MCEVQIITLFEPVKNYPRKCLMSDGDGEFW